VGSFEFAVCFVLASVVMYDATGVRQETGKQAQLLNLILDQDIFQLKGEQFEKRLKEFIGHTPLQVFAGAVLGILLAVFVHTFY
jgi:acid phosphatase family membrane protein YuiD